MVLSKACSVVSAMQEAHGAPAPGIKNRSASQFAPAQAIEI
jgi:hypothetical protein